MKLPEILTDTRGRISDEFWGIWKTEMGFDINEARNIIGALEDKWYRGTHRDSRDHSIATISHWCARIRCLKGRPKSS